MEEPLQIHGIHSLTDVFGEIDDTDADKFAEKEMHQRLRGDDVILPEKYGQT